MDSEAAETGNAARGASRRKPSTGFPVVSLAEASEILKAAGRYGFEHSITAFAGYMGHNSTNSGAFRQRLAAFRDWKLIAGRGDSLGMTEIARIIALPPDPAAEQRALRDAFGNCTVFYKLYDESAKGTPLNRQRLGNRAVHEFHVSPNSVNKFVDSFVESAVVAGIGEVSDDGEVTLLVPTEDSGARTEQPAGPTPAATLRPPSMTRSGIPVVHQSWGIAGGTIVFEISCDQPLPATAFATVGQVVASLEHLARALSSEASDIGVGAPMPTE